MMTLFLASVKKMVLLRSWTVILMTMTMTDEMKPVRGMNLCIMMTVSKTALKMKGRSE